MRDASDASLLSTRVQRSRGGCERCRRRRQKCSEERPSCSRCIAARSPCSYKPLNIRWGGRDFVQSRFGDCRVNKTETDPGSFVYTAQRTRPRYSPPSQPADSSQPVYEDTPRHASGLSAPAPERTLSVAPHLSPELRILLDDFVREGSAAISTNRQIQEEACRALVPVAFEAHTLLHAIAAFSAAQRAAQVETGGLVFTRLKTQEALSRTICIRSLQDEINSIGITNLPNSVSRPDTLRAAVVVAASLMLCVGALFSDTDDYNAWRIYLQGARAALPAALSSSDSSLQPPSFSSGEDPLAHYLRQRYTMLETLALLSDGGFEALDPAHACAVTKSPVMQLRARPALTGTTANTLNNHAGCGADIMDLLRTIGAVAWERRQWQLHYDKHSDKRSKGAHADGDASIEDKESRGDSDHARFRSPRSPSPLLCEADFVHEADLLDIAIQAAMQCDRGMQPACQSSSVATHRLHEFTICNEIYGHMARLYVRTKIRGMPASDPAVQAFIRKIVQIAARLELRPGGLSPAIGLNTALSVAGEYALEAEDRRAILSLLQALHGATHNHNLVVTMQSLQGIWAAWPEESPRDNGKDLAQETAQPPTSTPSFSGHDFISY